MFGGGSELVSPICSEQLVDREIAIAVEGEAQACGRRRPWRPGDPDVLHPAAALDPEIFGGEQRHAAVEHAVRPDEGEVDQPLAQRLGRCVAVDHLEIVDAVEQQPAAHVDGGGEDALAAAAGAAMLERAGHDCLVRVTDRSVVSSSIR